MTPDQHPQTMKSARLGVFIVNTEAQPTQTVYIKATLQECSLVLMTEAAGLALAVQITQLMELTNITFLSDCQQLVQFLNASDHTNPPDWRIKHFTQLYCNLAQNRNLRIFKISRTLNTTADTLARQALSNTGHQGSGIVSQCSFMSTMYLSVPFLKLYSL
jgi:ribonuclease HI